MTTPRHFKETQLDLAWSQLTELTRKLIVIQFKDKELGQQYESMLNHVKQDHHVKGEIHLGLRRAPGSKNRHHNYEGGLVDHLLEMWAIWQKLSEVVKAGRHELLSDSLLWRAILHHDLNKVHRYKLVTEDPWEVEYAENMKNSLLSSTHLVLWTLSQHDIRMPAVLHNALIVAEGGFSRDERPRTESVLAKLVYVLDELSANVVNRLDLQRFWDSKQGGLDAQG